MNLKDSMTYLENLKKAYSIYKSMLLDKDNLYNRIEYHFRKEAHPGAVSIIYDYKSPLSKKIILDDSEKGQPIVEVIINRMALLIEEIEVVEKAISKFNKSMEMDVDDFSTIIKAKKQLKKTYVSLNRIRAHEYKYYDEGYIFNKNFEQVKYRYPVRVIKTIDFDRNKIRKLIKKSDYVINLESKKLSRYLTEMELDFTPTLEEKVKYYIVDGTSNR